jgi:citrate lyase subunit beta / citryl-CoA lyase
VTAQRVRRSWLLVPAHRTDLMERLDTFGADVIVLDLEDLVHDQRKYAARANIREGIDRARRGGAEVFVRCDLELLYADLEASVWRGLQGVVLPKVTSVAQIREAEELLEHFEIERGVRQAGLLHEIDEFDAPRSVENSLEIHLSLENAEGNHSAVELIEFSRRVRSVSLGRADLVMDLRNEPNGELHLMPFLLQRLVIVAHTTGVTPIGAWWQATSRGTRDSPENSERAARLGWLAGFKGGLCVDPEQVAALNAGFTPAEAESPDWSEACALRDAARRQAIAWAEKEVAHV